MIRRSRAHSWEAHVPPGEREVGAAMLITVMVITVVAVLSTSVAVLAARSTRTAGDVQTAGVVKDLANAGLAAGLTYLQQVGVTSEIANPTPINAAANPDAQPMRHAQATRSTRLRQTGRLRVPLRSMLAREGHMRFGLSE